MHIPKNKIIASVSNIFVVPAEGLEPPSLCRESVLSASRMPFRHAGINQNLVPMVGFEPTISFEKTFLRRSRIPVPPHRHMVYNISSSEAFTLISLVNQLAAKL
jgi:hypothetical protein